MFNAMSFAINIGNFSYFFSILKNERSPIWVIITPFFNCLWLARRSKSLFCALNYALNVGSVAFWHAIRIKIYSHGQKTIRKEFFPFEQAVAIANRALSVALF